MKPVRLSLRVLAHLAAWAATAALAACVSSSPPSRFYTLGPGGAGTASADSTTAAHAAKPALLIEVPPIDVPSQVAKNQLVVQAGDARVEVLEQDRWASPPADEIRRALSGDLAARLDTFDVFGTPYPADASVYRITVNVRRFESWPGSRTVLDAVWSVRSLRTQATVTCRTLAQESVGAGYDALVDGHRRALARMADDIAAAVRSVGTGARQACARDASNVS